MPFVNLAVAIRHLDKKKHVRVGPFDSSDPPSESHLFRNIKFRVGVVMRISCQTRHEHCKAKTDNDLCWRALALVHHCFILRGNPESSCTFPADNVIALCWCTIMRDGSIPDP